MAVLIVVFLEIVDVEQKQRDQAELLDGPLAGLAQILFEVTPVVESGELIRDGQMLQSGKLFLQNQQPTGQVSQLRQKMPGGCLIIV
ncbi:MAG: hypothetical protein NZ561_07510, partial [Phycisphaerae bacterium]|nr:hypothetical protein [Phycisphaerae bacterium]